MKKHNDQGSIVLEAALILPLFLSFIFIWIAVAQLAIAEIGLHSAVTSTAKQIAAYFYPVDYVVQELQYSPAGQDLAEAVGKIKLTREKLLQAEQITDQYAMIIPDSLLKLMEHEQSIRLEAEQKASHAYVQLLNAVFLPLLWEHVDQWKGHAVLRKEQLKITNVTLPQFGAGGERFFAIKAEYRVKLPVPFFQIEWTLHKQGYERVWSGM